MNVAELADWASRTANLFQVKDVIRDRWTPPPRVKLLCLRGRDVHVTGELMSLSIEWHRLDPEDYVEPA